MWVWDLRSGHAAPSSPGSLSTESMKDAGVFAGSQREESCKKKERRQVVVFFWHMLDIWGIEGVRRENSNQWSELNYVLSNKRLLLDLVFGKGSSGGEPEALPGPKENLEPQEPIGFESRETHVATAGALVTWGTGRTWPPHLVWCLADPVAPGREKVPRRRGQRVT